MNKIVILLSFLITFSNVTKAIDTLYTNPNYPPLVYSNSEFNFFKYTARYIPANMFQAFKILGAQDEVIIERFKNRTEAQVVKYGMHYASSRMRKEFCLEGYSKFVFYFHKQGIYYPRAMETYILLGFHQYLTESKINWSDNKKISLEYGRKANRIWKKRKRKLFRGTKVKTSESRGKNRKRLSKPDKVEGNPDDTFWKEFSE